MKNILLLLTGIIIATLSFAQKKTFYDFKVKDIDGNEVDLKKYKGKKVLVVNVASKSDYTGQYKDLQLLYKHYKDSNLVILAFPCNDFNGQEPGTEKEIKAFCVKNYGITFPLMSKVTIKGKDCIPLYNWLQHRSENGVQDNDVVWSFNKFMINEDGSFGGYVPAAILPTNRVIVDWIMDR